MVSSDKVLKIDNPKNVVIQINLGQGQYLDLDITQSFYYRLEEVKKPVYGFNERHYSKVLAGKTIASGGIVIKKHAKDSILRKIKGTKEESLNAQIAADIRTKFGTIYEILNSTTIQEEYLENKIDYDEFSEEEMEKKKTSMDNGTTFFESQMARFNSGVLQEQIALRVAQSREQSKGMVIDDLFKLGHSTDINIRVSFETAQGQEPYYLNFTKVQFVSKESNVSVGQYDIDETYSFIANIDS